MKVYDEDEEEEVVTGVSKDNQYLLYSIYSTYSTYSTRISLELRTY